MTRVPAMRTLENALRRVGFVHVAGCDEVGPRLPGRPGRGGRGGAASRPAHSRASAIRRPVPAAERERLYERILTHAIAWAVAAADPGRNRSHQHPPGVAARDAARHPGAGAAARHRAGRRVPHSRAADGAARRAARRPPLLGDRGGVDRRQGDARPSDAANCTRAIRATASIATKATRPPIISTPSRASATRTCTAARSGLRRCLIRCDRRLTSSCRSIAPPRCATPRNCSGRGSSIPPSRNTCASSRTSRATGSREHARRSVRARRPESTRRSSSSVRIADSLSEEGFLPKAGGALQEDPQAEARSRARAAAGRRDSRRARGCYADARAYLNAV